MTDKRSLRFCASYYEIGGPRDYSFPSVCPAVYQQVHEDLWDQQVYYAIENHPEFSRQGDVVEHIRISAQQDYR